MPTIELDQTEVQAHGAPAAAAAGAGSEVITFPQKNQQPLSFYELPPVIQNVVCSYLNMYYFYGAYYQRPMPKDIEPERKVRTDMIYQKGQSILTYRISEATQALAQEKKELVFRGPNRLYTGEGWLKSEEEISNYKSLLNILLNHPWGCLHVGLKLVIPEFLFDLCKDRNPASLTYKDRYMRITRVVNEFLNDPFDDLMEMCSIADVRQLIEPFKFSWGTPSNPAARNNHLFLAPPAARATAAAGAGAGVDAKSKALN